MLNTASILLLYSVLLLLLKETSRLQILLHTEKFNFKFDISYGGCVQFSRMISFFSPFPCISPAITSCVKRVRSKFSFKMILNAIVTKKMYSTIISLVNVTLLRIKIRDNLQDTRKVNLCSGFHVTLVH